MKTSIWHRMVIVSVILLGRSFHSNSALADSCPTPSFAAARTFAVGVKPYFVVVGDFNADGKPDLAVANDGSGDVSVLPGNGDGTFQSTVNYATGPRPESIAVGDFNGDGKPDLVVANFGSTNVSVLIGNGDCTVQSAVNYAAGPYP